MALLTLLSSMLLLGANTAFGFSSGHGITSSMSSTQLCGIAEWRDLGDMDAEASDLLNDGVFTRRIPVIPIPSDQIVLPGEKKYFQFQTDDELRLFQRALDRNHGIFALGAMIEDDTMMSKVQLMEIKDYNMGFGGEFGIFCTAQAVGRAKVHTLLENEKGISVDGQTCIEEPLMAVCEELFDLQESIHKMEEASQMALGVLEVVKILSQKEQDCLKTDHSDDHDVRIIRNVDKQKDGKEDEDYDELEETRQNRFARAFMDSLESDSQGYISATPSRDGVLSWKEINAVSWAAFSSSLTLSEDETYRLHALDQERITDRLKLATYWLSDVVQQVEQNSM